MNTVAALYVEPKGCYVGVPDVDSWDEARDARTYAGPYPVVAHPPCQRWGRFWHGSTRKPHQYKLGDDGGCFAAALAALKQWGGTLEHPAHSKAWDIFGLMKPTVGAGWQFDVLNDLWVCYVEQGHYGHFSRKPTWLIASGVSREDLPEFNWTRSEQRLPDWMIERYGYEKARRIGVVAMVGGKNKTAIRNATPEPFRDLLISIARKASGGMNPQAHQNPQLSRPVVFHRAVRSMRGAAGLSADLAWLSEKTDRFSSFKLVVGPAPGRAMPGTYYEGAMKLTIAEQAFLRAVQEMTMERYIWTPQRLRTLRRRDHVRRLRVFGGRA